MRKILYILYQPYKWLVFMPFFGLNTIVFGTLAVLVSTLISQKTGSFIGGALWARLNGCMTPIFVNVTGRENINKKQSYVITANHQSQYDIFVLYGWLGIDFKWVMKQELRKIPGLGIGSEKVGHIFIDRSNPKAALNTINEAKKKIINGTSVVFFPEGTRSEDGKLGEFKKGAYRFAVDLELPVLPVTIKGTNKILPPGSFNIFPGKATIHIHKPVSIEGYNYNNLNDLINTTKETIQSGLDMVTT